MAIAGIAVLLALGTWQLQRLEWKEALIAERQAQARAAPITLPVHITDPAALEFRRAEVAGRFLHDRELYLEGRSHHGQGGLHIVTPLALDDGRIVLVDRGWVPSERRPPENRRLGQVERPVIVLGHLRRGGWRGSDLFRPENQPETNTWLWPDLPAMAARTGLDGVITGLYVVAGPAANPGGLPIGSEAAVALRNDHLQYAVTWYALALVLLVVYVLYHVRTGADPGGESVT